MIEGPPTVNFDLVDIVTLLWRGKWLISLFSLLGFGVAFSIGMVLPKVYVAEGAVVVRAEAAVAPDADRAFNATAVNEAVVATERNVLAAEGLLARVAGQVTFPAASLAPSSISLQLQKIRQILPTSPVPSSDPAAELADKRLAIMKNAVGSAVEKGSSVIGVTAATVDPDFSASIVNKLLDNYMQDRVVAQQAAAQNVEVALQDRLRQTDDQIDKVQEGIASLMQQPDLIEGIEIPQAQRKLSTISGQLLQARQAVAERQAAYDAALRLHDDARGDPGRLAELLDTGSTSTSDIRRQFAEKQQELANLAARFGPQYPARAAVQQELDAISRRLSSEASRVVAQRKADLTAANQVVATLTAGLDSVQLSMSRDSRAMLGLDRERASLENLRRIAGAIQDRLIAVASQPVDPNARILTRAISPRLPTYPKKPLLGALGFTGGLVGSSIIILVLDFLRRLRRSVLGQAELLAAPLLGSIPLLHWRLRRGDGIVDGVRRAEFRRMGRAEIAFQGAALELADSIIRLNARVIAVTSALPNEGKSTISVILGRQLAKMGSRVLLIHCDLHFGRASYFSERGSLPMSSDTIPDIITDPDSQLGILELPTTRSPIEFLNSKCFREILNMAREQFDIILCDTPPVLSVPDPLLVARLSDAVMLVSEFDRKAGGVKAAELSRRIRATSKPLCGVVVTKVDDVDVNYATFLGYKPANRQRQLTIEPFR